MTVPRIGLVALVTILGLAACGDRRSAQTQGTAGQKDKGGLDFQGLTLQQTDKQGRPLWRLQADSAGYERGSQTGQLKNVQGELLQGGKAVYKVKAQQAQVQQQAEQLLLKGTVTVTDIDRKGVFTGKEFLWQPQQDLLTVRQNPQVKYPQAKVSATELRATRRSQQIEAQGKVVADASPSGLHLETEKLLWQVPQQQMTAGNVQQPKPQSVLVKGLTGVRAGDRVQGGLLQFDMKTQIAVLTTSALVELAKSGITVQGQQLAWDLKRKLVVSDRPLKIHSISQAVDATAEQGSIDIQNQLVQLQGKVQVVGERRPALLKTDHLAWSLTTQQIQAKGNVFYQQQKPTFTVRGPQAFGAIKKQEVMVTGGNVVTEIFP
jgi:LPS export ABC transporter protein LptC